MKKNIGMGDRVLRFILGAILLAFIFFVSNVFLKIGFGILGLFCIYESLSGWCALYAMLGRNTCPVR